MKLHYLVLHGHLNLLDVQLLHQVGIQLTLKN